MNKEQPWNVGEKVEAMYKSGHYLGEIVELRAQKAAIQILAVVKHPEQGDLHHPMNPDVPLFHQRKALAYQEIALVPLSHLRAYSGPIPDYRESLHSAIMREIESLERTKRWIEQSLREFTVLQEEYERSERP